MANTFHDTYIGHNNHAITANPDDGSYADIAARDADIAFQVNTNINKVIRVEDPISFYILSSINPTVWLEVTNTETTIIDSTIFAQLSSSVNQEPTTTNPEIITYNTQDDINGLTHSTTVNPGEITIDTKGVYFICPQPQVGKSSGGVRVDFDMFLQVYRGSGFINEPNLNIKLSIKDSDITDVIVSAFTIKLNIGDKIRMMQRVSNSTVGMGLKNTDPETGPPAIPRTPSIIFTMHRIGRF